MKALTFEEPKRVGFTEVEDLRLQDDEVLLAIHGCAICGGEIKVYKGLMAEKSYPVLVGGHEFSGTVAAVGKGVHGVREGDHLARCFQHWCGDCLNCRLGEPAFCLNARRYRGGGFSEYVAAYMPDQEHRRGLYKLPAGISLAEGALCEPIDCAIGALLKAEPRPGEWAVVLGLGGLGQMVAQMVSATGARVIGVDLMREKLQSARAYCYETVDSSAKDAVRKVFALTHGVGADLVIEVVGIPETFKQSMDLVRVGGRIVVAGAHLAHLADGVNVDRIFRRDIQIRGAKGPMPLLSSDGEPLAFRYLLDGLVDPASVLTTFPVDRAQQAFQAQAYGPVGKSVILQGA